MSVHFPLGFQLLPRHPPSELISARFFLSLLFFSALSGRCLPPCFPKLAVKSTVLLILFLKHKHEPCVAPGLPTLIWFQSKCVSTSNKGRRERPQSDFVSHYFFFYVIVLDLSSIVGHIYILYYCP